MRSKRGNKTREDNAKSFGGWVLDVERRVELKGNSRWSGRKGSCVSGEKSRKGLKEEGI